MSLAGESREDRSGWMGNCHVYAPAFIKTPAWATHERLLECPADMTVYPDCCLCKMRADETLCQIVTGPDMPLGLTSEEMHERIWDHFYEPRTEINCAPGFGCSAVPRRRSSRHLRAWRFQCQ